MAEDDQKGSTTESDPKGSMTETDPKGPTLRTAVGLGLIVILILAMLFVVQQLRHATAIQDCVASGRTNCVPITQGR